VNNSTVNDDRLFSEPRLSNHSKFD